MQKMRPQRSARLNHQGPHGMIGTDEPPLLTSEASASSAPFGSAVRAFVILSMASCETEHPTSVAP